MSGEFLMLGVIVQADNNSVGMRLVPEWKFRRGHSNIDRQGFAQSAEGSIAVGLTVMKSNTARFSDNVAHQGREVPAPKNPMESNRFIHLTSTSDHVQVGDLVCVELEHFKSRSKHVVLLRSVDHHNEGERWRRSGETLISDAIFSRLAQV
jgi:hypothetical protein